MSDLTLPQSADVDTALASAGEAERESVAALERATRENDMPPPTETGNAAVLNAVARMETTQSRILEAMQAGNNLLAENLGSFSRALANTDVSAQQAAASAEHVEEAITPPEDTAPKQSEQPEHITELPAKTVAESRSKAWWFGKAALRHGQKG